MNLEIPPGHFLGIVGASGCGKSTAISLLERFYDPTEGAILLDGVDIRESSISSHRAQLALVSQSTTLYQGTILENILLGMPADRLSDLAEADVHRVCKDANIYDFILSLP